MESPTAAAIIFGPHQHKNLISSLTDNPLIKKIILIRSSKCITANNAVSVEGDFPFSGKCVAKAIKNATDCPFVFVFSGSSDIDISNSEISRFLEIGQKQYGALYYADYYSGKRDPSSIRPVIDYQHGSIRDDFLFGPVQILSLAHVRRALEKFGGLTESKWAGLYELRLKVSLCGEIVRIPEPLSLVTNDCCGQTTFFDYLDPKQLEYQKEMEGVVTGHLKRIGAYCSHALKTAPENTNAYPVVASVIIPVRNREKTIADALKSALEQKTNFPFNVLVVQNHSTDRTRQEIEKVAQKDSRVIQIIPESKDLGIGGCWNQAVVSRHCGCYVCQLDSDDLYEGRYALSEMVDALSSGKHGMVVGSYRLVNFNLDEIPPGLIDHREWTGDNGRNNLLRVHGIGAPRAFPSALLKQHPFPNVSYGEDYAVALRISRDYKVGRIFKPLYLCRRWEDNTDEGLSLLEANRLAFYKDRLRTEEMRERCRKTN